MSDPRHLVVLGGGVGGYTAAIRGARHGLRVTLIEAGALGGTCLNVGCIPTKSLLHGSAMLRALPHHLALAGQGGGIDLPASALGNLVSEKNAVVDRLVGGVRTLVRRNRIEYVTGHAAFVGPKTLRLAKTGQEITGDIVVIATGSIVAAPPLEGMDDPDVIFSDAAIDLPERPDRIAIMGGGVIGVEFAQIFANLGSHVTVIELADRILGEEDREAADLLAALLEAQGVDVRTGTKVARIARGDAGLLLELDNGAAPIATDKVLVATGRRPNIDGLGLERAGIAVTQGAVRVDDRLRTGVPGVYAVGDVTGGPLLAHRAAAQAECALADCLGLDAPRFSALAMPRAVYTQPEIACVGLTEAEARAQGEVKIGRFPFSANGKALVGGAAEGFVKVIAEPAHGQILGVVMVGPDVSNLLGEATLAVQMEMTLAALAYTIHAHPTYSEALVEAAHDALDGGAIHKPPAGRGA